MGKVFKDGQEITVTRSASALCLCVLFMGGECLKPNQNTSIKNAAGVLYSCTIFNKLR